MFEVYSACPSEVRGSGPTPGSQSEYNVHPMKHYSVALVRERLAEALNEVDRGWMLSFAVLLLTFTLFNIPFPALVTILFAGGTALACGLMSTVSDLTLGFWGAAAIIFLPLFGLFALLLTRLLPGVIGKLLAAQLVLYGAIYPVVAGLDSDRQPLYLNICALALLAFTAGQLAARQWIKPARSAGQLAPNAIQCEA